MKNLILTISLFYCFNYNQTSAQINLIEQYEDAFTADTEESKAFMEQHYDLTKSNNVVTDMNLNEESMISDLIKTAREFESLKNEQLQNLRRNHETIETLNFALETIKDLICNKIARGELSLNKVNKLNMDCNNF